jgi:CubicO group peptidase (beta-lactamase class C family)
MPLAPRDGWTDRNQYSYLTAPNEHRELSADVRRANGVWTVALVDMPEDVSEKRSGQTSLVYGRLLPKGFTRENFAGHPAKPLDAARLSALLDWTRTAMKQTGVPGVGLGIVQDGRIVFAGGLGVRELGRPDPVDADTRFLVASNTKALTTLLLARQVDQGRFGWDTPARQLLPSFRLGSTETTAKVQVKHLICACTGLPRQDLEWIFEYGPMTPEKAIDLLGTMQPTSNFGELFQYSNPLAAAAGYIGGHMAHPQADLGAAYDRAMQEQVFGPLGMSRTTLDFAAARQANTATAHAPDIDGHMAVAVGEANASIVPVRPAGAAWSTVNDMLKYVSMELAQGVLPDGTRYVSREALQARQAPQVAVGADATYGMGLMVNRVYGTPVVHHGGDMIGFHSDMMWFPEQGVGAVVLTNADPGWLVRTMFRRKLIEVLFDARPEAAEGIAAQAQAHYIDLQADRRLLSVPADPALAAQLARRYENAALGSATVRTTGQGVVFDFGEWSSEVASRRNADGTWSAVTIAPGLNGYEFVLGMTEAGKRSLVIRDGQHEYQLVETE